MGKVEFSVTSPTLTNSTTNYQLGIDIHPTEEHENGPNNETNGLAKSVREVRRMNTFNAATEEEQRNIISLRYRADSMADSGDITNPTSTEAKIWNVFEQIFCFLKGMTIYQTRRRLQFIMVSQASINTVRIIPMILGLSYQATLPVLILYVTLILGWHGTKFLVPKFLLFYKIGMQMSLVVDLVWYTRGYNGRLDSVSSGTAVLMQGFFSILLSLLNLAGLLYGWKLRRIVKSVQNQRECDRAALATMTPTPIVRGSVHSSMVPMPSDGSESEGEVPRRTIVVGQDASTSPELIPVFSTNLIRTSKYTLYNFPFVFLRMQFSRLANVYTTIVVLLCFFNFSPVSPVASLTPLLIVFATSALKDVSEDLRRQKADKLVNSKPAHIIRKKSNEIQHIDGTWQDICVGDLLLLRDGEDVAADCILLATSRADGRCYVETANLDGETNLKIRMVAPSTKHFTTPDELLQAYEQIILDCDVPNKDLFTFHGVLKLTQDKEQVTETSLSVEHLVLRGSQSRHASWTIGLVIYTGAETKISMNASSVPLKRSFVEKTLDSMFVLVLILLFGISVACTLGNNNWHFDLAPPPDEDDPTSRLLNFTMPNPVTPARTTTPPWYIGNAAGKNGYIFLSYVILFNNLIPLSMYVTMEGVRFVHARFIENDLELYDEGTDTPAQVRNSNINEDLGQIQYIFSDKTGTLTKNEMVFAKCTIAGLRYNDMESAPSSEDEEKKPRRFQDPRLLGRLTSNHSTKEEIHAFLLVLTICNTVIPEEKDGEITYNASSPDEHALVVAANELGYCFLKREGTMCTASLQGIERTYEILQVLEFTSDRKRMSVVVRLPKEEGGGLILLCKGADDVIFDFLSPSQPQGVAHVTRGHLQEYASEGLRTLTSAMRRLSEDEYQRWYLHYREAELSLEHRAEKMAKVSSLLEMDLMLLGATAIEDRLQEGVEEAICSLRKAGINFWVLTGDKKETALSIGMSSHVIDDNMDVIVLGQRDKASLRAKLEELYVALVVDDRWGSDEHSGPFHVLYEAMKRGLRLGWVLFKTATIGRDQKAEEEGRKKRRRRGTTEKKQGINRNTSEHTSQEEEGEEEKSKLSDNSVIGLGDVEFEPKHDFVEEDGVEEEVEYAMVIDGKTLALVLEDDIKYLFLAVATECKSVICCRCSPAQKAAVVTLVTEPTLMFSPGNITLAIGDGANDVPMIQAANVGIGISGKEGRQAVLSSDYSLGQFRFLKRLLLVHGNYSYKRISKLILFSFMKNVALSISGFFLAIYSMYSGLLMYYGIFFTLYNALFTTIPIVFIAMYNQDVSPAVLMQYPTLYVNGLKNRSFNWMSFFGWCVLGIWHAFVIYAIPFFSNGYNPWNMISADAEVVTSSYNSNDVGLWACGTAAYTYLITASTLQVSLMTSNWTHANIISTIGTLVFYFLFMGLFSNIYGWTRMDLYETEIAYDTLNQVFRQSWFWLGLVVSTIGCILPNYIAKAGRVLFYPEPSHLMREWNRLAKGQEERGGVSTSIDSPRLIRRQTGFAFSQCPGESEMVMGTRQRTVASSTMTTV